MITGPTLRSPPKMVGGRPTENSGGGNTREYQEKGQTLQVKWLVNCKDPMHDCNRFLWQILHTTGEHWTDISKCIYWMLNPRRWTHQITKYWRWTIRHLYWSAQPERHPVVKRQINLLHRLNNFFVTPIMTLNLTLLEMRKSQNTNAK